MSKIQVRSFRNEHSELRSQQKAEESKVNVEKLEARVGRLPAPNAPDLNASCAFFSDQTLFSMIKRHHRQHTLGYKNQSRVRSFHDQWIDRRPQAKDVLPSRTLQEYDEDLVHQQQEHADRSDKSVFLNPLVPKRRRYLAEDNESIPLSALPIPTNAASPAASTSSASSKRQKTNRTQQRALVDRLLHPERQLEDYQEAHTAILEGDNEEHDGEEHDGDNAAEDNGGLQQQQHQDQDTPNEDSEDEQEEGAPSTSEIPHTELMQQYLDFVHQLRDSRLHSLRAENGIELLPRQRERLNYAKLNRKMFDDTNDVDHQDGEVNPGAEADKLTLDDKPEVVLTIATYHPLMAGHRVREFEMLGSQRLTDLRDFIFCVKDFVGDSDRKGKQPDGLVLNTWRKKLSASCLFIENVFYVDTRAVTELGLEEGSRDFPDYSEPIRRWVMENERYKQPGLAEYTRQDMQGVTFEDLTLELNHPYLFIHQDGCQHIIMVRDIRIHSKQDPPLRSAYPAVTYNWQFVRYKCRMCNVYPAAYMTVNDVMSGSSPCFFCKECYKPFHYDKDGNRVLNYQVTQYFGM